jgi:hypothetical protein
MKNHFSTAVLVAALAFLVPNNGAEADGALAMMQPMPASVQVVSAFAEATGAPFDAGTQKEPDPTIAWIMALGFLGVVITRRLRGQ